MGLAVGEAGFAGASGGFVGLAVGLGVPRWRWAMLGGGRRLSPSCHARSAEAISSSKSLCDGGGLTAAGLGASESWASAGPAGPGVSAGAAASTGAGAGDGALAGAGASAGASARVPGAEAPKKAAVKAWQKASLNSELAKSSGGGEGKPMDIVFEIYRG